MLTSNETREPELLFFRLGGLIAGILLIATLYFTLSDSFAKFLLDRNSKFFPFTIQNAMWLAFSVGIAELLARFISATRNSSELTHKILPEDNETILDHEDLGEIYRNVVSRDPYLFINRLLKRVIMQFQGSQSIDKASNLMNSSLELVMHEIDLRYNWLRYIMWFIPTLGFIGTVMGISLALNYAGQTEPTDPDLLTDVTGLLAVAFDTTLLALIMAAILVFFLHLVQTMEERSLNLAGQYCLDNLINRLYEGDLK